MEDIWTKEIVEKEIIKFDFLLGKNWCTNVLDLKEDATDKDYHEAFERDRMSLRTYIDCLEDLL